MKNIIKQILREGIEEARAVKGTALKEENLGELLNHFNHEFGFDNVYVSFRDSSHVGKINPNNKFNTPTGLYTYNLGKFLKEPITDITSFRNLFPFASDRKFAQFLVVKADAKILDSNTSKETLDAYVQKIMSIYKDNPSIIGLCRNWLNGTYQSYYGVSKNDTHKFWLFIYDVLPYLGDNTNKANQFSIVARQIGIDGFSDDECQGWIHPNEKCQTVFIRSNIFVENRELDLTKSFTSGPLRGFKTSIEDVQHIFNKYGYTISTLRNLLKKSKNPIAVLEIGFKDPELIKTMMEGDNFRNLIYQIDNDDTKRKLFIWLLQNETFISRLNPERLSSLVTSGKRYPHEIAQLIINNNNILSAVDGQALGNMLYFAPMEYVGLLSNKYFIEMVEDDVSLGYKLLTMVRDGNEDFYTHMTPQMIKAIKDSLNFRSFVNALKNSECAEMVYKLFKDKYDKISELSGPNHEFYATIEDFKSKFNLTETYKKILREGLLTKTKTDTRKVADFVNFAKKFLDIDDDIKVALAYERTPDIKTTAYYNTEGLVKVYVKDRAIIDICRSIAHELVHHKQNLDGRLTDTAKDGEDGSELENEANAKAGVIIRKWGKLNPELYK